MFRSEVLSGCLTNKQKEQGFSLVEEDDHFLNLLLNGKVVAVFSATGATVTAIRETADKIMGETS